MDKEIVIHTHTILFSHKEGNPDICEKTSQSEKDKYCISLICGITIQKRNKTKKQATTVLERSDYLCLPIARVWGKGELNEGGQVHKLPSLYKIRKY